MNAAFDVFFYEVFDEELVELRRFIPAHWHCGFTHQAIQETDHRVPPARVISTRTQSMLPEAWAQHLDGILSRSAGFDHLVRFANASSRPIATGHLFSYSGRAVAEHAALLWLALLRRLPLQQKAIRSFQRDNLTGRECLHRTLAVFGVGDIGHHVTVIGHALGMKVLGVDLVHKHSDVIYATKDEAVARADVVVCAMNLNETNLGYFAPDVLAQLSPEAVFINVARGEFARCADLLHCLEQNRLGGVGLDVYAEETLISPALRSGNHLDHPEFLAFKKLLDREDVILTPHNAFNTREAVVRKSEQSVRQIEFFFRHGTFSPTKLQEH